jgi:two-component system chemotaxis response regulator CheB
MDNPKNIIVIGGALGSMDALRAIFSGLTPDLPAAILVVVHGSPDSPLHLPTVLGRYTHWPVAYAEDGCKIEAGHIYIAPQASHLEIEAPGVIRLSTKPSPYPVHQEVDTLFTSAAAAYGNKVISIILSGSGSDGTEGAIAISAAGGWNIIQEISKAQKQGMPLNALRFDDPDEEVAVSQLSAQLLEAVETHFAHCLLKKQ